MSDPSPFRNLRFERPGRFPVKAVVIGAALVALTVAWAFVPHATLLWLLLPIVGALMWVASFGWRDALRALQALLRRLEAA